MNPSEVYESIVGMMSVSDFAELYPDRIAVKNFVVDSMKHNFLDDFGTQSVDEAVNGIVEHCRMNGATIID